MLVYGLLALFEGMETKITSGTNYRISSSVAVTVFLCNNVAPDSLHLQLHGDLPQHFDLQRFLCRLPALSGICRGRLMQNGLSFLPATCTLNGAPP